MAIKKSDCIRVRVRKGDPGGNTYFVTRPGRPEEPLCFRTLRKKYPLRCERPAGMSTWHTGTGACRLHGGTGGRPPVNGRQAYTSRAKLKRTRDAYLEDRDKLMDLSEELATLRAIFQEFLDVFADPNQDDYGIHLNRVIKIISTMGTLVDKISKIESRNKITAAEVMYLQATVADLLIKYIHDPVQQEQAVKELVMRFASDGVEDLIALEKRPALPSGDEDR